VPGAPPVPGAPYGPGSPPGAGAPWGSPGQGPIGRQRAHPGGTTILVLGILSLVLCAPLGLVAWLKGNAAMREIRSKPGLYSNQGTVQAGRILGAIGTVILFLGLLAGIIVFAVGGMEGERTSTGGEAEVRRCRAESAVLYTAALTWRSAHDSGRVGFDEPWPQSARDLTQPPTRLITGAPSLHTMSGPGTSPPVIKAKEGVCEDEGPITQPR
jgi:hypothetical protein